MTQAITTHLPHLRPAPQRGLALWVYGAILAQSACQQAVVTALVTHGAWHAVRPRLREWRYDGADNAAPCHTQLDVSCCFAPLLRWVITWWQGEALALALDATAHGERVVALVLSVRYRGCAIPVAWHLLPATQPGAWLPPILALVQQLQPAGPPTLRVLLLADRGVWSPRLWRQLQHVGWHPLIRLQSTRRV